MRLVRTDGGVGPALVVVLLLSAGLATLSAPAQAQEGGGDDVDLSMTVVGREVGCEETYCFETPVTAVAPNTTLHVTFVNPSDNSQPHSWFIMTDGEVQTGTQQSPEDALGGVDTKQLGENGTATFTVPEDASALYVWCNEPGHAESGMWELLGVGAGAPEHGESGLVAQNVGVPLFSYWVGVIAIFAMFAWLAITFFVLRYESSHHTDHRDRKKD